MSSIKDLKRITITVFNSSTLFILGVVFKGCLDGGYEETNNARYSQQLQTGTGWRASLGAKRFSLHY